MKNYKSLITSSLLLALIVATPIASFAEGNNKDKKDDGENKAKVEQVENRKQDNQGKESSKGNSFMNKFSDLFRKHDQEDSNKESKKAQNVTAPVISELEISSIKKNKATLTWVTDTRADTMVWFSTTSPVDTSVKPNKSRKALVFNHKIEAKKLEANTKYYVVVGSENNIGMTKSAELSFTTPLKKVDDDNNPPAVIDTTAPIISAFVIPSTSTTLAVNITTFTATDATGVTGYKLTESATAPLATDAGWSATAPTVYTFGTAGTKTLYAWAKDAAGNVSSSLNDTVVITLADTTAPVINGITTTITGTNVTVSWTTNEPATSSVFYSTGTPVDTNAILTPRVTNGALVTSHSLSIPSLTSSTLYHFIIKSADASNNVALSSESTFSTN